MKHSKFILKYFFLLIISIQLIFPIILVNNSRAEDPSIDYVDLKNIDLNFIKQSINEELIKNNIPNNKDVIFDVNLIGYLDNLEKNELNENKRIKILIEFKQELAKEKRIEILDSIFTFYEMINNYEIINGIQIKLSIKELIEKESIISNVAEIRRIYKSKIYTIPVITESKLKSSALNSNNFPNWWIPAIGADNLEYDGTGVKVAVFDTGIFNHPDLNIINSRVFIDEGETTDIHGHGTHVAGIIGSNGGSSGDLYRGVAPGVSLIDAHVGNMSGSIDDFDVIDAIEWAANPAKADADIISMSFGGTLFEENILLNQAISYAKRNYGTIFVVSAGNSGQNYYTGSPPATFIDTISVGATDETNDLASFSSWGPYLSYLGYPDVVAPGVNIISTSSTNSLIEKEKKLIGDFFDFSGTADYVPLSGTSMSCPIVSGALAILKQAFPTITPETARIAIQEGANKLPQLDNNDFLKYGAGLINVSASLEYLKTINSTYSDINNVSMVFPDLLPVKPFDLLHFPGDSQVFNLSIISGRSNTVNLEIPDNIPGISIISNNENIIFSEAGINFTEIKIEIKNDIEPGLKDFQINLSLNGIIIDTVDINLDIRLPEQRILMESFHGLNDWLNPDLSFPQIGFYDVIKDLAMKNISTDYFMEYWQPKYNISSDNLLLTEEYLAQYDLVILQNPILPYSPLEINNLKNYFNTGGNILFLGTVYDKMCTDNINHLFTELGTDTQIAKENVIEEEFIGIGTIVDTIPAVPVVNDTIFQYVDKFLWKYGSTFDVLGDAESIAQINNKTIATSYDGYSQGKGRFIAFGDLHWLYYDYLEESENYEQNHKIILSNLVSYYFENNNISITANLNSIRTSNGFLNITTYLKNQTSNLAIESNILNSSLTAIIKNDSFSQKIIFSSMVNGIAYNDTYQLPYTSHMSYEIELNLTINSKSYNRSFKILYYNTSLVPVITSLSSNPQSVVNKGSSIDLEANMNDSNYDNFNAYISLYSYGFQNQEETINESITMMNSVGTIYSNTFIIPTISSGYGIFYVTPSNENYTASYAPRHFFRIRNLAPVISESQSYFQIGNGVSTRLSDTVIGNSILLQQATQGNTISFEIQASDPEIGGDSQSDLRLSVSFFLTAISESVDGSSSIWPLFPNSFITTELVYNSSMHMGSFIIPNSMEFSTINGAKSITTAPSDQPNNYISIIYINVVDKEGAATDDPFIIAFMIKPTDTMIMAIIVIAIIGGIFAFAVVLYLLRRRKLKPENSGYRQYDDFNNSYVEENVDETSINQIDLKFCPFCGVKTSGSYNFCLICGKKFEFE
ncbi:MAG: S8 family serine peptidase [Candidatus Lokiarchaeota archaeon]|nr:S8 family serine peptidase [Candidatus Lokiarchaeota archaeon]